MFPNIFSLELGDGESGYDSNAREPHPSTYMGKLTFRSVSQAFDSDEDDCYDDIGEDCDGRDGPYTDHHYDFTPHDIYYSNRYGEMVYAYAGEQPDHTACDRECGWCGRCSY
jgi:hypothetical protein